MPKVSFLYFFAELQAFVVACYYYKYLRHNFLKWFVPFLGFVFVADVYAFYLFFERHISPIRNNYFVHAINTGFYCFILYHLYKNRIIKRVIIFGSAIGLSNYLIAYLFFEITIVNLTYCNLLLEVFIIVMSLLYLYKEIVSEDNLDLLSEPFFWILTGAVLFFSTTIICFLLTDLIRKNDLRILGLRLYTFVPQMMSIILYAFISIAIIVHRKKCYMEARHFNNEIHY